MLINGSEDYGEIDSPLYAISQFYRAFNRADINLMEQNWAGSSDVVMANPLGGIKQGWADIRAVYERIFNGPANVYVEFYDFQLQQTEQMFWVSGRERGTCERAGETLALAIRTSRVFAWDGLQWKQKLHHGSIDQSDALARYQAFVLTQ